MRSCGRMVTGVVGLAVLWSTGCVSVDEHQRVQAMNRDLNAQKQALNRQLLDERTSNQALQARLAGLEAESTTRRELINNLQNENNVLDDMRKMAISDLEDMAKRQQLGAIHIGANALPPELDRAIRDFVAMHPNMISYDANRGSIKFQSDLLFSLGSDVVKQSSMDALSALAQLLKSDAAKDFEVIVVGHTDNVPISRPETRAQHPTNWHLSSHRAISVGKALRKAGYPAARVGVLGYGEYRPIAPNGPGGNELNRRVEVYLVPAGAITGNVPANNDLSRKAAPDPTKP